MLDNADTFYLVSGGQAGGGTRERNVYDTRDTDVLSVLRVNCALASSRERRLVHRLLRGPEGGSERSKRFASVRLHRDQPISFDTSNDCRVTTDVRAQSHNFDGGVADATRALSHRLRLINNRK